MTQKIPFLTVLLLSLFSFTAQAYEPSWDGNHPAAKSEAWTWMGHLTELTSDASGNPRLGSRGFGYIFYYTRNDEGRLGTMNFRTASITPTNNGVGEQHFNETIYEAEYPDAELRVREGSLDLSYQAGPASDRVVAEEMTAADQAQLDSTLALFPGLRVAASFTPRKIHFSASSGERDRLELDYYSIWPVVSPPGGQLDFLGQSGTYEFSEPMLVTVGTFQGKRYVGLSFSDRQWAPQYFGTNMMNGLGNLLKYGRPMNYAHSWSAFHLFNQRTQEWSFYHLWHQFDRRPAEGDQPVNYSSLVWADGHGNGGVVNADQYDWKTSGFAQGKDENVMMAYANGRYGFFPSRAEITAPSLGLSLDLRATPASQTLDQPIYFYEGFASGAGTLRGDPVTAFGRLESSRYLYRYVDYQEMLAHLRAQTDPAWQQPALQQWLIDRLRLQDSDPPALFRGLRALASMFGDFRLKLAVFGSILSGKKGEPDPRDPSVVVY